MSVADPLVRMGWTSRLGFALSDPDSPPAAPTEELQFIDDSVANAQHREQTGGVIGLRSDPADRMLLMSEASAGAIIWEPTPATLLTWLPRILGAAAGSASSGVTPFTLGDVIPAFDVFSLRGEDLFIFRECQVASATFQCQEGGRLRCTMNVLGKALDVTAAYTWPSLTYDRVVPWKLAEAALTVNSTAFQFYSQALTIDNMLSPRYMSGKLAPTEFPTNGRRVMLGLGTPWGNGLPNYKTLRTAALSTCVLKYTRGSSTTARYVQFNLPKLIPPENRTPVVPGREEIRYEVELQSLATTTSGAVDANSELTVSVKSGDG